MAPTKDNDTEFVSIPRHTFAVVNWEIHARRALVQSIQQNLEICADPDDALLEVKSRQQIAEEIVADSLQLIEEFNRDFHRLRTMPAEAIEAEVAMMLGKTVKVPK